MNLNNIDCHDKKCSVHRSLIVSLNIFCNSFSSFQYHVSLIVKSELVTAHSFVSLITSRIENYIKRNVQQLTLSWIMSHLIQFLARLAFFILRKNLTRSTRITSATKLLFQNWFIDTVNSRAIKKRTCFSTRFFFLAKTICVLSAIAIVVIHESCFRSLIVLLQFKSSNALSNRF